MLSLFPDAGVAATNGSDYPINKTCSPNEEQCVVDSSDPLWCGKDIRNVYVFYNNKRLDIDDKDRDWIKLVRCGNCYCFEVRNPQAHQGYYELQADQLFDQLFKNVCMSVKQKADASENPKNDSLKLTTSMISFVAVNAAMILFAVGYW